MNILSVEYRKPSPAIVRELEVEWEFTVHTDENLPHGYPTLGGYLKHGADGLWVAAHYRNTAWGPSAATRQGAILNMLPLATEVLQASKLQRAADNREQARRINVTAQIQKRLQEKMGKGLKIEVDGNYQPDKPFDKFSLTITGLDMQQLELLTIAFEAR